MKQFSKLIATMLLSTALLLTSGVPLSSGTALSGKKVAADGDVALNSTNFPDAVFLSYVSQFDTVADGVLSAEERAAVTTIDLFYEENITSLSGIEYFPNLESLIKSYSAFSLTSLDISQNKKLKYLNCSNCGLTALDLRYNSSLESLDCSNNKLSSLDLSHNPNLAVLFCGSNQLTSLNISSLSKLNNIDCGFNSFTSLDLHKNTALEFIGCESMGLTSLNISGLTKLYSLRCSNNNLTSLNLASSTGLCFLFCEGNKLSSLDLSSIPIMVNMLSVATPFAEDGKASYFYDSYEGGGFLIHDVKTKVTPSPIPVPISNLTAVSAGKNAVRLSWKAEGYPDGYLIYGQKDGKYGYVGMTTTGTTFTDTKALANDYNYYWVFPYRKESSGKMTPGGCTKYVYAKGICPAVTGLKASSVKGGVKLTWGASSGAEGYLVYGIVAGKPYVYVGMTTTGTTFTDQTASSTEYNYYWVFPYFKDSNGKMIVGGTPKYTYGRAFK